MNPLAVELNQQIQDSNPSVFDNLSEFGRMTFFPKGILFQSAQAKQKAHKYNATIGIATHQGQPMHLGVTRKYFTNLDLKDIYPYAPPMGRPQLRSLWRAKIIKENPELNPENLSQPVVTSAITHGLSLVGDLFVDPGDIIISPDQLWGNYRMIYSVRKKAEIVTFPTFKDNKGLNTVALEETLTKQAKIKQKLLVLLNFPNNPTGYNINEDEADEITRILKKQVMNGTRLVVITDDSYFGLFYEDSYKHSIFSKLSGLHDNLLAIKLDGATKEDYAWGFRTGFITFGNPCLKRAQLFAALEKKLAGTIRGQISNCPHVSQTIIEKALQDPGYVADRQEKYQIMRARALRLKQLLQESRFQQHWDYYPFNSGYFMCLKLKKLNAENLRVHLLDKYGVGIIANNATDLRIAFSCIELDQLEDMMDLIQQAAQDLATGIVE